MVYPGKVEVVEPMETVPRQVLQDPGAAFLQVVKGLGLVLAFNKV
jgi:hypothetical protein